MGWRAVRLCAFLVFISGSRACDVQTLYDSAMECSTASVHFNLSKYETYITHLIDEGSKYSSAEEFLYANTFGEMARVFADLEPAAVWAINSFYTENLAPLDGETYIKPMFGNMSNMDELLTSALTSHCLIFNELSSCLVDKISSKCPAGTAVLKSLILDPLVGRYCSGTSVKSEAITFFNTYFAGLTNAFSCVVDTQNLPQKLQIRDFMSDPVIASFDIERLLVTCNMHPMKPVFEKFYADRLEDMFKDSNLSHIDVKELLTMGLPAEVFRLVRPMADCIVRQVLPMADQLCPTLDISGEIDRLRAEITFIAPIFLPEQTIIYNMIKNPLPMPDIASSYRYSVAMLGNSHMYSHDGEGTWMASCPVTGDEEQLVLAVSEGAVYRKQGGQVMTLIVGETQLLFNATGMFLSVSGSPEIGLHVLPPALLQAKLTEIGWMTDSVSVSTDQMTHLYFILKTYGAVVYFGKANGKNWIVSMRAANGLHRLAQGAVVKGCGTDGTGIKAAVTTAANGASDGCKSACDTAGLMSDPCIYDCIVDPENDMQAEIDTLLTFEVEAKKFDRTAVSYASNREAASYAPCGGKGFVHNPVAVCGAEAVLAKRLENFTSSDTLLTTILKAGVMEPYALYGVSALVEMFVAGTDSTPNRKFLNETSMNYTQFLEPATLLGVMQQHCRFVGPYMKCMERVLPQFCKASGPAFVENFVKFFAGRYCTNPNSENRSVKQDVFDAMMSVRATLLEEFKCFVNGTNTVDFQLDMGKMMVMYDAIKDRCAFSHVVEFMEDMVQNTETGDVLADIQTFLRLARNPIRCALKVAPTVCPEVNVDSLVDKLVLHLNRVTAGTLNFNREWFIKTQIANVASRVRVTMMAVGDPHIQHMGATSPSVCDSPGLTDFFSNDEGVRILLRGFNAPAKEGAEATVIRNISLQIWEADAADDATPALTYEARDGDLSSTFTNGNTSIIVSGFEISMEIKKNGKAVFIRNKEAGLVLSIFAFKDFFNLVMRAAEDYASQGSGLLVYGCGLDAKNVSDLNAGTASFAARRRRAVTAEECLTACVTVPSQLNAQCIFDCTVTEDLTVAGAHSGTIEVEAEVVNEDISIIEYLETTSASPATTAGVRADESTTASADKLCFSIGLLMLVFILYV